MVHKFINKKTGNKSRKNVFHFVLFLRVRKRGENKQTVSLRSASAGGKMNESAGNSFNFKAVRVSASQENISEDNKSKLHCILIRSLYMSASKQGL